MRYRPTFEEFAELARTASVVPIYRQLVGDTLTPVSAFCKIQEGDWAFLFESVIGGERLGRYSFLGSGPFLRFQAHDRRVRIEQSVERGARSAERKQGTALRAPRSALNDTIEEMDHPDPLRLLEERLASYRAPHLPGLPRFCGGAVGYAGYDTVRYVERLPNPPPDDRSLPDLCFALYDRMVIFDHINKTIAVVAHAHVPGIRGQGPGVSKEDLASCYREACERVDRLVERLQQGVADLQLTDIAPVGEFHLPYRSNFEPAAFESAVEKCKEYIRAGDIFQVVLSQRLQTETKARPFDIYRALRVINPSPFMFYLKAGPICLVGASPEIMVRVEEDRVTIRPLAGTRRRGKSEEEDERLAAELIADPKERAEHIMLVDLGRNDVGRVARYGTVQLSDVMMVERYSHVMHICSNVTGRLQEGKSAFDALRACLPAGTLSGAPKVRAMEIIDELEPHRRGPYGGAVGYVDFSGNMDTCIALRTLVLLGQTAYIQAGAGIVADSVPATEREETLNKAMGLLRALEIAETQL
ncbi:MAG TPA: anthranilate synthase component I [Gemmataceae bacterium]|nr:anthranilate synthase component I [Gemmataceae bacterium]